jgi:hypothetical protein
MNSKQKLIIDSSKGGNGDIWMRLVSFYAIAGVLTNYEIHLLIPVFLRKLAKYTFGDRIIISDEEDVSLIQLSYTNLGMLDLVKGISRGKRYISPYQRSVINDKKTKQVKDFINIPLFIIADFLGVVQVPAWKWLTSYQGYLDIIGIKKLRKVGYEQFIAQLQADYESIYAKLNGQIPVSSELQLPSDLKENIIVFPNGTSRQFMPVWWAKQNLPGAYYAFYNNDPDANEFKEAGLKTIAFYGPGDIISLSHFSKWTVSTDSFPSHLLQYSSKKCTVTLTEALKSKIISPVFKGLVVDSLVACHPCLHMARKVQPYCAAGFMECQNWKNTTYTQNIINSLPY